MSELRIERFEAPAETRTFEKGSLELVAIGGMTVGRATYQPGWKWSEHVGPTAGTESCEVEHVGIVVSGQAAVRMDDGTECRDEGGRPVLRPAGPRQLGGGRRALRLAAPPRRRQIRKRAAGLGP